MVIFVKGFTYYGHSANDASKPFLGLGVPDWIGILGIGGGIVLMLIRARRAPRVLPPREADGVRRPDRGGHAGGRVRARGLDAVADRTVSAMSARAVVLARRARARSSCGPALERRARGRCLHRRRPASPACGRPMSSSRAAPRPRGRGAGGPACRLRRLGAQRRLGAGQDLRLRWRRGARAADPARARAMAQAIQQTVDEVGAVVEREGIDCDWRHGGSLTVAQSETQLARLRAEAAAERDALGDDLALAAARTPTRARGAAARRRRRGALFTPHCARVQPARLVGGPGRRRRARRRDDPRSQRR